MGLWISTKQNPDWILGSEGVAHQLCSALLHPVPLHKLMARLVLRAPRAPSFEHITLRAHHRWEPGGAEQAVGNNWGGEYSSCLVVWNHSIYGFHSGPSLQITLSKQSVLHECWFCKSSWHCSFCPVGHIKACLFSLARFPSHSNARPSLLNSWKASSALKRPEVSNYTEGLVCQVLGPNLESPVQGPKRKALQKMGPIEKVTQWGALGAINPHHGAWYWSWNTHAKPSWQNRLPERKQGNNCTDVAEDLQAKPARMDGSEIMRSDGGGRM